MDLARVCVEIDAAQRQYSGKSLHQATDFERGLCA
jgi:hypothetical protein